MPPSLSEGSAPHETRNARQCRQRFHHPGEQARDVELTRPIPKGSPGFWNGAGIPGPLPVRDVGNGRGRNDRPPPFPSSTSRRKSAPPSLGARRSRLKAPDHEARAGTSAIVSVTSPEPPEFVPGAATGPSRRPASPVASAELRRTSTETSGPVSDVTTFPQNTRPFRPSP